MSQLPPHLPSPTCRIDTYHRLQNLRWILFIFGISFLSGLAAALIVVAWIVPSAGDNIGLYLKGYRFADNNTPVLDPTFAHQLEQKTVRIFNKNSLANNVAGKDSMFGRGALISSDGWLVVFYPAFVSGLEKDWVAADDQGILYHFEKAVFDNYSQLLYLRLAGQGFRVNSFFDWSDAQPEISLWAMGWRWQAVGAENIGGASGNRRSSDLILSRQLSGIFKVGDLLYTNNGDLAGLTNKNGKVIPSWVIENQVNNLLSKQKVAYIFAPWSGFWVNEIKDGGKLVPLRGFFVSGVTGKPAKYPLQKGDIVLTIEGRPVSEELLAKQFFFAPARFSVTVWRKGTEVDISIDK